MLYLPFFKNMLELLNSVLLLLKFRLECLGFSRTCLRLADASLRLPKFLLELKLLLPHFLSVSILSLFQVLPISQLRTKLSSFVLSKLERTLERGNLSIQGVSFRGETSKFGGCRRRCCRCIRMSLSEAPEIFLGTQRKPRDKI